MRDLHLRRITGFPAFCASLYEPGLNIQRKRT